MESFREVVAYGPEVVAVPFSFTTDGGGSPTLVGDGGGVVESVAAPGGGVYRLTLAMPFAALLYASAIHGGASPSTNKLDYKTNDVTSTSAPTVDFINGAPAATATSGAYNESTTTTLADLAASGAFPHQAGATPTLVTAADATDLASSKTLAQDLAVQFALHDDDENIHPAADTGALACAAWASSPGLPADLAEVIAVANELKSDWNTHVAKLHAGSVDYHMGGDLRNTINSADADDQAKSNTLLNELKKKFNRSVVAKPAAHVLLKSGGTQTQATVTPSTAAAALASRTVYGCLFLQKG